MENSEKEYFSAVLKLRAKIRLMDIKIGAAESDLMELYKTRADDPNLNDFSEMYNELIFQLEERKQRYTSKIKEIQEVYNCSNKGVVKELNVEVIRENLIRQRKTNILEEALNTVKGKTNSKALGLFELINKNNG
ncbi:MAG: hypothetical protein PHW96_04700 [Candidatus Nanoarchaeia archaeon]|nr:hypothetical protein [Candidatus Nanoarchaeia archaeon]